MKKLIQVFLIPLILLSTNNIGIAQDVIVLRNGDEIQAKVLEIKQLEITYKNWTNIDGPVYTKNKADIFMIKYSNGSRDVFELEKSPANNFSKTTSSNFVGTWYDKKYNGKTNQSVILITPAGDNFLVEAKMRVYLDNIWGTDYYETAGSFKEVGHLENGSLVINSDTKLSLINDNTLLMRGDEYYKQRAADKSESPKEPEEKKLTKEDKPIYEGEYKDGLKHGKGKMTYKNGSYFEGEWKNDIINGYGKNTVFSTGVGEKVKYACEGYWFNNKVISDSLIIMYVDDRIDRIGHFIEGKDGLVLYNGLDVVPSSKKNTYKLEIIENGIATKAVKNIKNEEPITKENWLSFYNMKF